MSNPLDDLLNAPGEAGDVERSYAANPPLPGETPADTSARIITTQRVQQAAQATVNRIKGRDLAQRNIPTFQDQGGNVHPVTDHTGAPVTQYDKTHNVGYDATGNPVQVTPDPAGGAPAVEDAFKDVPTTVDDKTGAQYKIRAGLPWRYEGQDAATTATALEKEKDRVVKDASTALGRQLTLDERQLHRDTVDYKAGRKALLGTVPSLDGADVSDPDALHKTIDDHFNQLYAAPEANETAGWFGTGGLSPQSTVIRNQLDQQKATAHQQLDALTNLRTHIDARQQHVDQQTAIQAGLVQQQTDKAIQKARDLGVIPPAEQPAEPKPAVAATPITAEKLSPEQQFTASAIQEAKAGKKPYGINDDYTVKLDDQKPLDSITEAVRDGVLPNPSDEVWSALKEKQQAIEAAGDHPEIKAALLGAGRGAAFLAAAPIGAGLGAEVGALGGPIGSGIGGILGGLASGTAGSWAYGKLAETLAAHNDTINSFVQSSKINPGYAAIGELAAFGAGLPKAAMSAAGRIIQSGADAAAAVSNIPGLTAEAVRAADATARASEAAKVAAGTAPGAVQQTDAAFTASRYLDAVAKSYKSSGGGLKATIEDLTERASIQRAGGASKVDVGALIARDVLVSSAGMVAIDTAIKEGSKALGLSDKGQTWSGAGTAALLGAMAAGHGIKNERFSTDQVGDILLRGAAHFKTGTPFGEQAPIDKIATDLGVQDAAQATRMAQPLTPEEIEIWHALGQKAADIDAVNQSGDKVIATARQSLKNGRTQGIAAVEVGSEPRGGTSEPPTAPSGNPLSPTLSPQSGEQPASGTGAAPAAPVTPSPTSAPTGPAGSPPSSAEPTEKPAEGENAMEGGTATPGGNVAVPPEGSSDSELEKPPIDGGLSHSKLFGDSPEAESLSTKGLQSLPVDRQHVVVAHVRAALDDKEILKAVIQAVPIDVMHGLVGSEATPDSLFHDPSVLTHRLSIAGDVPVSQPIIHFIDSLSSSLKGGLAGGNAKKAGLTPAKSSGSGKGSGAVRAGYRPGGHIVKTEVAGQPITVDINPTEAQKKAGNYLKGAIKIGGMDITIENPAGSSRRPEWPPLASHYGYIRSTEGNDGDHLDVFIKPGTPTDYSGPVFVVNQNKPDGYFDEHKAVIGVSTPEEARALYASNYSRVPQIHSVASFGSVEEFRQWAHSTRAPKEEAQAVAPTPEPTRAPEPTEKPTAPEVKAPAEKPIPPRPESSPEAAAVALARKTATAALKLHSEALTKLGHPQAFGDKVSDAKSGISTDLATGRVIINPEAIARATDKMDKQKAAEWIKRAVAHEVIHVATLEYAKASPENRAKLLSLLEDKELIQQAGEAYGSEWAGLSDFAKAAEAARMLVEGPEELTEASYKFLDSFLKWLKEKLGNLSNDARDVIRGIEERMGRFKAATSAETKKPSKKPPAKKEPANPPAEPTWKKVGVNKQGNDVFEDKNGVRSYTEGDFRFTRAVGIAPGDGISVEKPTGHYATVDQAEVPAPNLDPAAQAIQDALGDLFAAEPTPDAYAAPIPPEKRDALRKLAATLMDDHQVDTPEKLASKLFQLPPAARRFSQQLWFKLKWEGAQGDDRPDWASLYGQSKKLRKTQTAIEPEATVAQTHQPDTITPNEKPPVPPASFGSPANESGSGAENPPTGSDVPGEPNPGAEGQAGIRPAEVGGVPAGDERRIADTLKSQSENLPHFKASGYQIAQSDAVASPGMLASLWDREVKWNPAEIARSFAIIRSRDLNPYPWLEAIVEHEGIHASDITLHTPGRILDVHERLTKLLPPEILATYATYGGATTANYISAEHVARLVQYRMSGRFVDQLSGKNPAEVVSEMQRVLEISQPEEVEIHARRLQGFIESAAGELAAADPNALRVGDRVKTTSGEGAIATKKGKRLTVDLDKGVTIGANTDHVEAIPQPTPQAKAAAAATAAHGAPATKAEEAYQSVRAAEQEARQTWQNAVGKARAIGRSVKGLFTELKTIDDYWRTKGQWLGTGDPGDPRSTGRQKSDLENRQMERAIEKKFSPIVQEAVTNFIQADGDPDVLRDRAAKSRPLYAEAYRRAASLTPEERELVKVAKDFYAEKARQAQEAGLLDELLADYINQLWDRRNDNSHASQAARNRNLGAVGPGRLNTRFENAFHRIHESYFAGEQKGLTPFTKKVGKLMAVYAESFDRVMSNRAFVKKLANNITMTDGRPAAVISGYGKVVADDPDGALLINPRGKPDEASDYVRVENPALRGWKFINVDENGKQTFIQGDLLIHPEIAQDLKNTLGRSALANVPVLKEIRNLQFAVKQTLLSLSAFHFVQEATHAIGHTINPFNPMQIDINDPVQRELINGGLMVASNEARRDFMEGVAGGGLIDRLPIIGKFNQQLNAILFEDYIPRLKMTMALHALDRNMARYKDELAKGTITREQLIWKTAQQANDAFGEQNYRLMGRSQTFQDILRLTMLAPDFLESRMRFAADAATKFGGEQRRALAILAAVMFITAKLVEKALTGDYDFKHPFSVTYKGREYKLRSVPGDMIELFSDTRRFIYGRISPIISRGIIEGLTGRDWRGQKRSFAEQLEDLVKTPIPMAVRGLVDKRNDITPGEQLIGAIGGHIKRHSDITDIRNAAREWQIKNGKQNPDEAFPPSKYLTLKYALEDGDERKARAAFGELAKKQGREQTISGFKQSVGRPFSGSFADEPAFVKSLSASDKAVYTRATAKRAAMLTMLQRIAGQTTAAEAPSRPKPTRQSHNPALMFRGF